MAAITNDQMTLLVGKAFTYEGRPPRYDLPFEIGCYSIDAESTYRDDGHQMKYLYMPDKLTDLHMDLNEGFSDHIYRYEDSDFTFSAMLKWILSHQELISKHFLDLSSCR